MRASRSVTVLAGTAAVALATVVVASPASAAILPDGQKTSVVQDYWLGESGVAQTWDVNPANAVGTAVGTSQPVFINAWDVDDEGHGYAIGAPSDSEELVDLLYRADAAAGTFADPLEITIPGVDSFFCAALDYRPGVALYASCQWEAGDDFFSAFGTIAPATADFTPIAIMGDDPEEVVYTIRALATDPVTGQLWAFLEAGNLDSFATTVDPASGAFGPLIPLDADVDGADFDRNGQLFATSTDHSANTRELATVNLAAGLVQAVDEFSFSGQSSEDIEAITVWGKPALAATGSTNGDLALSVGLGSALLLLAGAAFVATSRVQRRNA